MRPVPLVALTHGRPWDWPQDFRWAPSKLPAAAGYRFVDPPVARYTPPLTVVFPEGADSQSPLALTIPGDFGEGGLVYPFAPVGVASTPTA